jgi:hypothetical protein
MSAREFHPDFWRLPVTLGMKIIQDFQFSEVSPRIL